MGFRDFLEMSSLRDLLGNIPQNPKHHPEGNVLTHTRMVRRSIEDAIAILKQSQQNPQSSLKKVDFDLTKEDRDILRVAAWMHDIGKVTATAMTPSKGIQSIAHETPEHFIANMRKLKGGQWENIWNSAKDLLAKKIYFS